MRQIIFGIIAICAFASCNKDYTCSCTFPSKPEMNFEVKLSSMRHNDAKVACTDYNYYIDTASVRDGSCGLK